MNKLIDEALKKITTSEELLEKLLLIDNIDDLYEFFISQKAGYSKDDLVKYFVQIAKDNMVSEENLEKVSGGIINQKFSKALCASLAALTLVSLPAPTCGASANTTSSTKSSQNNSQILHNVKDKISQKANQIKNAIKDHPITSSAATSALTFYGLYKKIIDPKFESLKRKDAYLNDRIDRTQVLYDSLNNYMHSVHQRVSNRFDRDSELFNTFQAQLDHLSQDNINAVAHLGRLSIDLHDYIQRSGADNRALTVQINNLVRDITNLQERGVNELDDRGVHESVALINRQVQNILQTLQEHEINVPIVRDYHDAREIRTAPECDLSSINGSTYLPNYISRIDVNISNDQEVSEISRQLDELCNQFQRTRGLNVEDRYSGWEQSATEYFFTRTNRYAQLDDDHKKVLLQCIKAMYTNKDNETWHDIIDSTLLLFSSHGRHCSLRATAIINTAYNCLRQFLRENHIGLDGNAVNTENNAGTPMQQTFTNLKDAMVQKAQELYLSDRREDDEPLIGCNNMIYQLRCLLGMSRSNGTNSGQTAAAEYFQRVMDKKYLIETSNQILNNSLEENQRSTILDNVNDENLSFANYCKFSGKSHEEIERLISAIESYPDGDFKNMLRDWVQGTISLPLATSQSTVDGVVTPIVKNVPFNSLTAIQGEDNRYQYTDDEGHQHVCRILRNAGNRRQIEYVGELNSGTVQRNIISMLDILSSKARREDRLARNDGNLIGCPELDNINGFKFIITCFNNGYLQDRER